MTCLLKLAQKAIPVSILMMLIREASKTSFSRWYGAYILKLTFSNNFQALNHFLAVLDQAKNLKRLKRERKVELLLYKTAWRNLKNQNFLMRKTNGIVLNVKTMFKQLRLCKFTKLLLFLLFLSKDLRQVDLDMLATVMVIRVEVANSTLMSISLLMG